MTTSNTLPLTHAPPPGGGHDLGARPVERSLVVLDPETPSSTLRAALRRPDLLEDGISLLVVFPTAEYEARRLARLQAGVTAPYTLDHLEREARRIARRTGRQWIDPNGADFEALGAVGGVAECVATAVERDGYATVYVASHPRTVWHRLLGGASRSAALSRVLPPAVGVIGLQTGLDPDPTGPDDDPVGELVIAPDAPLGK